MDDTVNAFVEIFERGGAAGGPLDGRTLAVKDLYDVAGHVAGCGNPDWARAHSPATGDAPPVAMLSAAGARIVGRTHTDELAYSLMGVNEHYGTPVNSAAPDRVPGGSSSGSAAAVAAGLADIGLGSDTGGSVRMPASFCGLWGIRTSFGAIPLERTMPLAPSFDTVGWFTTGPGLLADVGAVFGLAGGALSQALLPVDVWAAASPATVDAIAPRLAEIEALAGSARPVRLAAEGLETWREAFRIHQGREVWQVHGGWVTETGPRFGAGIAARFAMAREIGDDEFDWSQTMRAAIRSRMDAVLGADGFLVMPTSPGPAPPRTADQASLDEFRARALEVLCPAGHSGLPQISMPAGSVDGGPVGLSIVGPPGSDGALLALAQALGD